MDTWRKMNGFLILHINHGSTLLQMEAMLTILGKVFPNRHAQGMADEYAADAPRHQIIAANVRRDKQQTLVRTQGRLNMFPTVDTYSGS